MCNLPFCTNCVQREGGGLTDENFGDSKASSSRLEACLKIRGLGVDTAGTLDAVASALCAAAKGKRGARSTGGVGSGGGKTSGQTVLGVMEEEEDGDEGEEGQLDGSRRNREESSDSLASASGAAASGIPGDIRGDLGDSPIDPAVEVAGVTISSTLPDLWSLQFAYSQVDKVLDALETAVSGLTFVVVGEEAGQTEEPQASALW